MEPTPEHWTDAVAGVRCPVLIAMGSKDPDFPDPLAEARLAEELLRPHAASVEVAIIDGGGHLPHAELPEATLAVLQPFLATTHPCAEGEGVASDHQRRSLHL